MVLLACGVNHKTAPLDVRERFAFASNELQDSLLTLVEHPGVHEAVLLSTCNRTELYCDSDDVTLPLQWLVKQRNQKAEIVAPHWFQLSGRPAIQHTMRVASGLDSLVLGEPQILGQMKQAFNLARQLGTIGSNLGRLFQYVFSVTKQVRTETAIGSNAISVAYVAANITQQIFSDISKLKVLLIGAGQTSSLVAKHLQTRGVQQLYIANRNKERADILAEHFQGHGVAMKDIPVLLPQTDIVISATASTLPILGKGLVETALKARKHRPMLMIDLAVPRDIEAEVKELDDVYLYTIDDLQGIADDGLIERQDAAKQAEEIIEIQTEHFMRWLHSLDSVSTILNYRNSVESIRDDLIAKALHRIKNGNEPEVVVKSLAKRLANILMHEPTVQMRNASYNGDEEILRAANKLFGLVERDI